MRAVVEKLLSVVFRCHEAEAALRSLPEVAGVAELEVGVQREDLVLGELELEADVGLQQRCQCHRAYTRPHLHPGTHLDLLAVLHAQCHRRGAPARREVDGGDLLGQAVEVPRDTDEVATGASDLRHGAAWLAVQVVAAPTKQSQGSAGPHLCVNFAADGAVPNAVLVEHDALETFGQHGREDNGQHAHDDPYTDVTLAQLILVSHERVCLTSHMAASTATAPASLHAQQSARKTATSTRTQSVNDAQHPSSPRARRRHAGGLLGDFGSPRCWSTTTVENSEQGHPQSVVVRACESIVCQALPPWPVQLHTCCRGNGSISWLSGIAQRTVGGGFAVDVLALRALPRLLCIGLGVLHCTLPIHDGCRWGEESVHRCETKMRAAVA